MSDPQAPHVLGSDGLLNHPGDASEGVMRHRGSRADPLSRFGEWNSLQELLGWLDFAPNGTLLAADQLRGLLQALIKRQPAKPETLPAGDASLTWRERIWIVPEQTRLGCRELAEAVGRPVSWVYRRTSERSGCGLLPHHKLDGELVFVAGEIRSWIDRHEQVIVEVCKRTGNGA